MNVDIQLEISFMSAQVKEGIGTTLLFMWHDLKR